MPSSEDVLEPMVTLTHPHGCLSPEVTIASPHTSRKKKEKLDLYFIDTIEVILSSALP